MWSISQNSINRTKANRCSKKGVGMGPRLSSAEAERIKEYINRNLDRALSHQELSEFLGLSRRQFARKFANTFGASPHQYVLHRRIAIAKQMIVTGALLIEIAGAVGFASQPHFQKVFRRLTGITPGKFRRECTDKAGPYSNAA